MNFAIDLNEFVAFGVFVFITSGRNILTLRLLVAAPGCKTRGNA